MKLTDLLAYYADVWHHQVNTIWQMVWLGGGE